MSKFKRCITYIELPESLRASQSLSETFPCTGYNNNNNNDNMNNNDNHNNDNNKAFYIKGKAPRGNRVAFS